MTRPLRIVSLLGTVWLVGWLGASSSDAAQVNWQKDLQTAAKLAEQSKRPLLLQFTADWCGYCHKMEKETFRDGRVVAQIESCYLPVQVNFDANRKLANSLGVTSLPTTAVVFVDSKNVHLLEGFQSPGVMIAELTKLCPVVPRQPARAVIETTSAVTAGPMHSQRPIEAAFSGNCLVSLVDDRVFRMGDTATPLNHRGTILNFASAEHRQRFESDPERYWPLWDGYCPVSLADEKVRRPGSLKSAVMYKGRLVLLANADHQASFTENPRLYQQLVDEQAALRGVPASFSQSSH